MPTALAATTTRNVEKEYAMIKLMVTIRMINLVPVSINVTRDEFGICLVPVGSISIQK